MSKTLLPILDLQDAVEEVGRDRSAFRLVWSSSPNWPKSATTPDSTSHIAVLDSSFNPPHNAHLEIASSALPARTPVSGDSPGTPSEAEAYSARLLLFSVRNIEKVAKAGDASVDQRLEMTILLAKRLASLFGNSSPGGVAVGVINEPTFVGKSHIIRSHLCSTLIDSHSHPFEGHDLRLSFLIGTDTLTRFFDPKFYPLGMDKALGQFFDGYPSGDGSLLVSAKRGADRRDREVEEEVLLRPGAKEWVQRGCVRLLDRVTTGLEDCSSSSIRKAVCEKDEETLSKLLPTEIREYVDREGLYSV